MIFEEIGPGDRIPLHRHSIDESIVVLEGIGETTLGDDHRSVEPGAVISIPAGTAHGTRNAGETPLRIQATFRATGIQTEMVEPNPVPGDRSEAAGHHGG